MAPQRFTATLEERWIVVPVNAKKLWGEARPPVAGTLNGVPFRGRLAVYGGETILGFTNAFRAEVGVTHLHRPVRGVGLLVEGLDVAEVERTVLGRQDPTGEPHADGAYTAVCVDDFFFAGELCGFFHFIVQLDSLNRIQLEKCPS